MSDISVLAQEAPRVAVESVLNKLKEGKKLSTEDIFLAYLATITRELEEMRKEIAGTNQRMLEIQNELDKRIDETNRRIDEVNKRIDELSKRIDDVEKRIDAVAQSLGQRIDGLYAVLLDIHKLLVGIAGKS